MPPCMPNLELASLTVSPSPLLPTTCSFFLIINLLLLYVDFPLACGVDGLLAPQTLAWGVSTR